MKIAITITLLSLATVACTTNQPKTLGIPLPQWQQLSSSQQENAIEKYNLPNGHLYRNQPTITLDNSPTPNNELPSNKILGSTTHFKKTNTSTKPSASWLQLNNK